MTPERMLVLVVFVGLAVTALWIGSGWTAAGPALGAVAILVDTWRSRRAEARRAATD
ncbi:hypothetical protein [Cellulomonas oligotrophica]|uniref:Uncharacterized protein n=1 Tax=Cellulomonas oligotrophica TaxID=931536 RepID=A0A7Y9FFA4_9CELL|nr:hypothetical protein [Cellulomonas oligotrophica]NYD86258.1 hypothetical protein [Cellulomonas oligotrophica]GIG34416.1 hypothetical protein Col01nite_35750 [Cellulomonas oligotrophica]